MPTKSVADQIFQAAAESAEKKISEFPKVGLSIEYDKRGKYPTMVIRVMPSVKIKTQTARGEAK